MCAPFVFLSLHPKLADLTTEAIQVTLESFLKWQQRLSILLPISLSCDQERILVLLSILVSTIDLFWSIPQYFNFSKPSLPSPV